MKTVNGCKDRWTVKTDEFTLFDYCNFLVLLSTTICSQNINKQNVNIADETFTDDSFLSSYHYTKSNNYLKIRFQIRHWIPMFIGTPCMFSAIANAVSSVPFKLKIKENFFFSWIKRCKEEFMLTKCNMNYCNQAFGI